MIGKGARSDIAAILAMILGFVVISEVTHPGSIQHLANEIQWAKTKAK